MKQELKSEITQANIINTAFNLFYQNGFKNTSIDKIAAELQLTKGAFYHHFKNKRELATAVIQQKLRARIAVGMIQPIYDKPNMKAKELLKELFVNRISSFSAIEKSLGCPLNNLIHEIGGLENIYQHTLRTIVEDWKQALYTLLERGKINGEIQTATDSKATAIYLISAFEGIRGLRKLYDNDIIITQYCNALETHINHL